MAMMVFTNHSLRGLEQAVPRNTDHGCRGTDSGLSRGFRRQPDEHWSEELRRRSLGPHPPSASRRSCRYLVNAQVNLYGDVAGIGGAVARVQALSGFARDLLRPVRITARHADRRAGRAVLDILNGKAPFRPDERPVYRAHAAPPART